MQLHNRNVVLPLREEDWQGNEALPEESFDFDRVLGIARRQWRVVAICAAVAALLGLAYAMNATPLYTAKTSVIIDRGNNALLEQLSDVGTVLDDEGTVLSQVELLKSETIALSVVNKNKLYENPEFMANSGSLLGSIKSFVVSIVNVSSWFASETLTVDEIEARRKAAVGKIMGGVGVERVGRTYVLQISYTSPSPELAALISNAVGEAYLTDKLDSKYDATRRAGDWLQDRIAELRLKALETDLAVQKFRTAKGLVSTGTLLISDQQLSELNSALIVAQSDTAKARAKYERIQQIISSGQTDAIVTDVLVSSISNELRQKYLNASKLEAEIADRLGPNHSQAVRLRGEMSEYKRLMFEEISRIAESYKSELEVSEAREKSLMESVANATGVSASANETQVQLRELEREAETYKNLYQSFLERYQQAVQQQSFPVTDARVISRASVPTRPSSPKTMMIIAMFFTLGAGVGTGLGAFREYRDRFFRTGEQLRDELGLEFLGIAPLVKEDNRPAAGSQDPSFNNPTVIRKTSSIANYIPDHPLSAFAEGLRSAKIAADLRFPSKPCKIIGVVSTLPGEGKSTVAINFAELLASQGARTMLIDADLRNPGATRALAGHATAGILEAILEGRPIQELLLFNPKSKLAFLPAVIKQRVPHSSELLTSAEMQRLLTGLSSKLDYIVLDLPPLAPVVDARAMASKIDGFIYVVEWGGIARRTVRHTLSNEPHIQDKCLGVILNKVDIEKMKLYHAYGSTEYYYSRYSKYYHES